MVEKLRLNADLHFHPSFFSRGAKRHITEWKTPSLAEILKKAVERRLQIAAITSCSTSEHIDKRWEAYMQERTDFFSYKAEFNQPNLIVYRRLSNGLFYLMHGQEFKTDKADINVLFAEKRVPIESSGGNLDYVLDAALDSGEGVLITLPHPARKCILTEAEILGLYERRKIDAIESHDAIDILTKNQKAKELAFRLRIPGIAVSDGHRLEDMGKAYTVFNLDMKDVPQTNSELGLLVKKSLAKGEKGFERVEGYCSNLSRALYFVRVLNAIVYHKFLGGNKK